MLDFVGQLALTIHGSTVQPFVPGHSAMTVRSPVGVVAAIAPRNNPLGLLSWKLVPALAAGNTVVLSRRVFRRAFFNVVTGDGKGRCSTYRSPERQQDRLHRVDVNGPCDR
jgi:acyl-CoA reductase-like NAD-dependent aldehyde dehydrogenase